MNIIFDNPVKMKSVVEMSHRSSMLSVSLSAVNDLSQHYEYIFFRRRSLPSDNKKEPEEKESLIRAIQTTVVAITLQSRDKDENITKSPRERRTERIEVRYASQCRRGGARRNATWSAARSQSHCKTEQEEGEEGRGIKSFCPLAGRRPRYGLARHPGKGSAVFLSAVSF